MKKLQAGNSEQGADQNAGSVERIIAPGNLCQTTAECIRSRCHILYNGEGQMKSLLCRAHALLIPFNEPMQA